MVLDKSSLSYFAELKLLVIEDSLSMREQMLADLHALGIESKIFEAETIKDALHILKTERIGFVIADWNLPDGNSYDLLIKFRKEPKYKDVPYLMCTTMNDISSILNAVKSGANDYIVKPWTIEELKKKLSAFKKA